MIRKVRLVACFFRDFGSWLMNEASGEVFCAAFGMDNDLTLKWGEKKDA